MTYISSYILDRKNRECEESSNFLLFSKDIDCRFEQLLHILIIDDDDFEIDVKQLDEKKHTIVDEDSGDKSEQNQVRIIYFKKLYISL